MRSNPHCLFLFSVVMTIANGAYASNLKEQKSRIVEDTSISKSPIRSLENIPPVRLLVKSGATRISEPDYYRLKAGCDYKECANAGQIEWQVHPNSDDILDYVILTGSSGSAGREYMILLSKADGTHEVVFKDYTQGFKIEDGHSKWKTLISENYLPNEMQKCPESSNGPKMIKHLVSYEFDGTDFRRTRAWEELREPPCM